MLFCKACMQPSPSHAHTAINCRKIAVSSAAATLSAPTESLFKYEVWLRSRDSNPEPCG